MITQERLKELLEYNPDTGIFTWKVSRGPIKKGSIAGSKNSKGYWRIQVLGKEYLAHRLAFIWMTGSCPDRVDHENRIYDDLKWDNLRSATNSQNQANKGKNPGNTSGYKNVYWRENRKRWIVVVQKDGQKYRNGSYEHIQDAINAANDLRKNLYGEFAYYEEYRND
ncbi:homing endonuclease [Salmonella phage vB_SalS_SA001]|uniref:Homing endonuclease n=1 Tax=Salmonella phage vB_SalS_SA001 TaxID=2739751 RepID=A0A7D3UJN0_9CAUD|nr:homing endonuclease [Salmonella phage vB_SalS_SA001]